MSRKTPSVNDIVRVGRVTAVYAERHTVTVEFSDRGENGIVTKELPVGVPLTRKNHAYALPDEGEHVVCVFFGNGLSEGIVLCAIYDAQNEPPCQNRDRYYIEFEGGAHLLVDRKEQVMQIMDFFGSYLKFAGSDIVMQSKRHIQLNPGSDAPVPLHVASTLGGE